MGMHLKLNKVQDIIVACCVLHNIARYEEGRIDPPNEEQIDVQIRVAAQLDDYQHAHRKTRIQDFLIENYFA